MRRTAAILLVLSIILFAFDRAGWLALPKGFLERALSFPIILPKFSENQELDRLRQENVKLISQLVDQQNLLNENQALRIQLGAKRQSPLLEDKNLLPAGVLAVNTDFMIIDKGKQDVAEGAIVVYKNILIGRVVAVSTNRSRVELVTRLGSKIVAKTQKGALGIVGVAGGGGLVLEKVTLKETLEVGDLVVTGPDGFLPDLLIGQITKVLREESALFQKAQLKSPIDSRFIETVFIVL